MSRKSGRTTRSAPCAPGPIDDHDTPPSPLEALSGVWCFDASVGKDVALCNLVLSAEE
jgi:hypothetical protein